MWQILEVWERQSRAQDLWKRSCLRCQRLKVPYWELWLPPQCWVWRQDRDWWVILLAYTSEHAECYVLFHVHVLWPKKWQIFLSFHDSQDGSTTVAKNMEHYEILINFLVINGSSGTCYTGHHIHLGDARFDSCWTS